MNLLQPSSVPARRRAAHRLAGFGTALALTLTLAACGGDDEDSTTATDAAGAAAAADAAAGAGSAPGPGTAPVFPKPSAAPAGVKALPGVPAITKNGDKFDLEPTIAKGTGDAPAGLVIRDLIVGQGIKVEPTDSVEVRYVGVLYSNGTVFDSSWERGKDPIEFALAGVVPGFAGGIVGMQIGGRREIVIPAELGYGPQAAGLIPPNSVLVFVVDLTGIGRPDKP